jgi:hypothetical protein
VRSGSRHVGTALSLFFEVLLLKLVVKLTEDSRVCSGAFMASKPTHLHPELPIEPPVYTGMENTQFKNLSRMEICRRMSALCQKSADETIPGVDQDRFQMASDKFRDEADSLAIEDLKQALLPSLRFH